MKRLRRKAVDILLAVFAFPAGALLRRARKGWAHVPLTRKLLRVAGVFPLREHYYEPVAFPEDLRRPLSQERDLPGLDLNLGGQLALLENLRYAEELARFPLGPVKKSATPRFCYRNGSFEAGDSEVLYSIIRHAKPRRIVEIGSGHSTLMARLAIEKNEAEDPDASCRHVCIEPYEQPWLEKTGAEIVRKRVELCSFDLFDELRENDILFVDSSHVIRPQGDVLFEVLEVLGRLKSGVLIHVHDIFTPRDYPDEWVVRDQKLWTEQYLVEAFLAFNREFSVVAALNHLANDHRDRLAEVCPILASEPDAQPRSLWLKRN